VRDPADEPGLLGCVLALGFALEREVPLIVVVTGVYDYRLFI
jgi:hypothetical protein